MAKLLLFCFPFSLHFFTSLIIFTLWNSGKAQEATLFLQTKGRQRDKEGERGLFQQGPKGSCLVTKITVKTCDFQECVPGKAQCSSHPYHISVCFEAWFFLLRGYEGFLFFAFMNIQRMLLRGTNDTILQVSGHINHCFQKLKQSCLRS